MSTSLLKYLTIACGVCVILVLPLLFASTQHRPFTPPDEILRGNTPHRRIKPPPFTHDRDTQTPFQETEFYRTIVDNNLFRPLGWRPARPKEDFRLIGTRIPTDGKTAPQAILQAMPENKTYIVTTGDTLAKDTIVTDVQSKRVTLEKAGRRRTLKLSTNPWLK